MRAIKILLAVLIMAPAAFVQTAYQIDWYVISSGGGHTESGSYQADASIGQPIVGQSASPSYFLESGFWVGAAPVSTIENEYLPGDANMRNGIWPPQTIGADVTYLVNYFRSISVPCILSGLFIAADANGDCQVIGSDVTRMVNYFRGTGDLSWCPQYPPAWLTPEDCPIEAPAGWPNCETPPVSSKIINGSSVK